MTRNEMRMKRGRNDLNAPAGPIHPITNARVIQEKKSKAERPPKMIRLLFGYG